MENMAKELRTLSLSA